MKTTIKAADWATEKACKAFRAEMADGCGVFCVGAEEEGEDTIEEYFFECRDGAQVVAFANVSEHHTEIIEA